MFGKQSLKAIEQTTSCDTQLKIDEAEVDKDHVFTIKFNGGLLAPTDEAYVGKAVKSQLLIYAVSATNPDASTIGQMNFDQKRRKLEFDQIGIDQGKEEAGEPEVIDAETKEEQERL